MENSKPCKCGLPEKWASDAEVPVEFDKRLNEFHLRDRRGGQWIMRYCLSCGGRLPESKRSDLFLKMDDKEEKDVCAIKKKIHNLQDMKVVLGEPDVVVSIRPDPEQERIYGGRRAIRCHEYSKRWRTILLHINEMENGEIEIQYSAKHKS